MGDAKLHRSSAEVLIFTSGPAKLHRSSAEVLIFTSGPAKLYRSSAEVLYNPNGGRQLRWGSRLKGNLLMPAGLMLDLEAGVSAAFQTSGGSAAEADNDPVGVWRDKINNRDALASGTARPLLKLNAYNGRPTMRFDGSDDMFTIAGDALDYITNPTIFVVCKATAAGGRMLISKSHTMSGWSSPYNRWGWYNNGSFYSAWNGNGTNTNTWSTGDLKILELVDADGYANGVKVTDGADADLTYPNGLTPILIGGNGVGSERWSGDICRVMVFNRSLTDLERLSVRTTLASAYGITLP